MSMTILVIVTKNVSDNSSNTIQIYFHRGFFKSMTILVIDSAFTLLDKLFSADLGIDVTLLRVVRIARVVRLVRSNRGLLRLFRTLYYSLPSLGNVGMLLLLFIFVFAYCLGSAQQENRARLEVAGHAVEQIP